MPGGEVFMSLSMLSGPDDGVIRLMCEGHISALHFDPDGPDPLYSLVGEGCFARRVLIDMAKASFIDSSGIGWLITCHKQFKEHGGMLVLHSIPPRVRQTLDFLRIGAIIQIADDEKAALDKVRGEAA
jgi:anti-anti-sigma factor